MFAYVKFYAEISPFLGNFALLSHLKETVAKSYWTLFEASDEFTLGRAKRLLLF